ncbi:MAG: hypothetical protein UY50_C0027G0011 [Parcubacteria group bacterium GW2011_GWA2_49_9]|nr:MAG: hypothetical protein UY50_C0027G0011 [Parcubacteria group bacterium GW2011_GWA2_49_9]
MELLNHYIGGRFRCNSVTNIDRNMFCCVEIDVIGKKREASSCPRFYFGETTLHLEDSGTPFVKGDGETKSLDFVSLRLLRCSLLQRENKKHYHPVSKTKHPSLERRGGRGGRQLLFLFVAIRWTLIRIFVCLSCVFNRPEFPNHVHFNFPRIFKLFFNAVSYVSREFFRL